MNHDDAEADSGEYRRSLNIPGSDQYPIQFIKEIRRKYIQAAQSHQNVKKK